jgi:hypothetical protein
VLEGERSRVGPHPPHLGHDPPQVGRVDELLHALVDRDLEARRQAEDPAQLVGEGQLVGAEVPLPAADPGDPLGLGELPLAGPQQLLGPGLLGDVAAQRHPAADDSRGVAQGHEGERPPPGRVLVAGEAVLGALPGEGGQAAGPDGLGLAGPGDLGHRQPDEVLLRPAVGAQAAAGRGPHPELGVEGEEDQAGQVVGLELEVGLVGSCLGGLSGHDRPPLFRSRTTTNHKRELNATTKRHSYYRNCLIVTTRPSRRSGRLRRTGPVAAGAGRRCGSRPE